MYFIQSIPRDENWKPRRDVLAAFEPKKPEDCALYNVQSADFPEKKQSSLAQQVHFLDKLETFSQTKRCPLKQANSIMTYSPTKSIPPLAVFDCKCPFSRE